MSKNKNHQLSNIKCGICEKFISELILQDQKMMRKKNLFSFCMHWMYVSGYPFYVDIGFGDCNICNHRGL